MTQDIEQKRQEIMDRIEASRVKLLAEMTDEDREYARQFPAWSMEYRAYHQTLVDAGITNG